MSAIVPYAPPARPPRHAAAVFHHADPRRPVTLPAPGGRPAPALGAGRAPGAARGDAYRRFVRATGLSRGDFRRLGFYTAPLPT